MTRCRRVSVRGIRSPRGAEMQRADVNQPRGRNPHGLERFRLPARHEVLAFVSATVAPLSSVIKRQLPYQLPTVIFCAARRRGCVRDAGRVAVWADRACVVESRLASGQVAIF